MVYQVFTDASVKKVRYPFSSMRAYANQISINMVGKIQDSVFDIHIVVYIDGVIVNGEIGNEFFHHIYRNMRWLEAARSVYHG
jgi:hypothetical protein